MSEPTVNGSPPPLASSPPPALVSAAVSPPLLVVSLPPPHPATTSAAIATRKTANSAVSRVLLIRYCLRSKNCLNPGEDTQMLRRGLYPSGQRGSGSV